MSINLIVLYWNYIIVIMLMMAGLYIIISNQNFIKKLVGLSIFQSSVFIFYLGKVSGGTAPILTGIEDTVYSNPLPHVLILTAIVVGVATNALGLALVVRIQEAFKSIEEHKLLALKKEDGLKDIQIEDSKEDSKEDSAV
jgi:multicomponent Na+:H+ antiporter subunit C